MEFISATRHDSQGEVSGENDADDDTRHHDREAAEASGPEPDDFACPVCGARQALSDTCRRCRADLTLVMGLYSELAAKRAQCLALVRQRRLLRATRLAKQCLELSRRRAQPPLTGHMLPAPRRLRRGATDQKITSTQTFATICGCLLVSRDAADWIYWVSERTLPKGR